MALQLRRGTNAQRLAITPANGELIFVTDYTSASVTPLWVGDGTTAGGVSGDTNTTYTQNISSVSGGANLNLVGSDSTTDTVKFASGTGVTVAFTDASTATVSIGQSVATSASPTFAAGSFSSLVLRGSTSGTNTFVSPATAGTQSYTLPTAYPAANGYTLHSTTAGVLSWAIDDSVTYTQNISSTTGGANLNLVGTDSTTDTVKFASGTGVTVAFTDASTATITNTGVTSNIAGTGISVNSATGAVTISNTGVTSLTTSSGLSTNTNATGAVSITNTGVTSLTTSSGLSTNTNATGAVSITNTGVTSLGAGTGVTLSGSTGGVTVSIGQDVATSANVTFNSIAFGGNLITHGTGIRTFSGGEFTLFNFDGGTYRSAKIQVNIGYPSFFQAVELFVLAGDSDAFMTVTNDLRTSINLSDFSVTRSGGLILVKATPKYNPGGIDLGTLYKYVVTFAGDVS